MPGERELSLAAACRRQFVLLRLTGRSNEVSTDSPEAFAFGTEIFPSLDEIACFQVQIAFLVNHEIFVNITHMLLHCIHLVSLLFEEHLSIIAIKASYR